MSWLRDGIRKAGRNLGKAGAAAGAIGGGVAGFAVGGPAGAAVGAGIGSSLGEEAGNIASRNLDREISGGKGGAAAPEPDLVPQYLYDAQGAIQAAEKEGKPLQTGDTVIPGITLQEERENGWVILDSTKSPSRILLVPRIEGSFGESEAKKLITNVVVRSALAGLGTYVITRIWGK